MPWVAVGGEEGQGCWRGNLACRPEGVAASSSGCPRIGGESRGGSAWDEGEAEDADPPVSSRRSRDSGNSGDFRDDL